MVTIYKQKVAPSCPLLRMVLSGLAQEVKLLQAGSPERLFWLPSKGNPSATREQPRLETQRSNSSAERFCNTGQHVDLGEQKPMFLHRVSQPKAHQATEAGTASPAL